MRRSPFTLTAVVVAVLLLAGAAAASVQRPTAASAGQPETIAPLRFDATPPGPVEPDYTAGVYLRSIEIERYLAAAARPAPRRTPPRASRSARRTVVSSGACDDACRAHLARIGACESNGYADRRNPTYRGRYQFSRATWASVGGVGDPADAPPAEQDARAEALYARSGPGQWPRCGR